MTILLWIAVNLVVVSFAEYAAHRWLMHRPLIRSIHRPHFLHHYRYYRVFNHEGDATGRQLNLRINWLDTGWGLLLALPVAFLSPQGYGILLVMAFLHRWLWKSLSRTPSFPSPSPPGQEFQRDAAALRLAAGYAGEGDDGGCLGVGGGAASVIC